MARFRSKVSRGASRRRFNRGARRTRKVNLSPRVMRGGIRF